ncbi:MAG: UDP-N-acetylmuramoyl-L-alanine--D-glutamate ligase [Tissierellia bacterium]|nr:UDP-N-acetylmuramoyl-L-alanine--D-glutamate ligase [Tissierellia bacterium]
MKKILILGIGVSGLSAAEAMLEIGNKVYIYDDNIKDFDELPDSIKDKDVYLIKDLNDILSVQYDHIMKSPGIKPDNTCVRLLKTANYKIISDLELGYLFRKTDNIIAVTGTNGKTTCSILINAILKDQAISSEAVGNIGIGAVKKLIDAKDSDALVIECSSFQLDDISSFKPQTALITNISVDHIDFHKTYENYKSAKMKIASNMTNRETLILNADDEVLKDAEFDTKILYFGTDENLENGIYFDKENFYHIRDKRKTPILDKKDVNLLGEHNMYNIAAALCTAMARELDLEKASETIKNFKSVEHRLEFVRKCSGIEFYNDSKGTNPNSTKNAIDAFDKNINIIMGGYDKKVDFTELLAHAKEKVKSIVTIGETKFKIYNKAIELGYENVKTANSLSEAIMLSIEFANTGEVILLSPACASWDMFKNYEERGNYFKEIINKLD